MTKVTSVFIADDHAIFREGLLRVLELSSDMRVSGMATNGREVLQGATAGEHDVLLLDLNMPGPSRIELIKRMRSEAPSLPILVMTVHNEAEIARRAIAAGAAGYLTKDSDPEVLHEAIHNVARGRNFVDREIASKLLFHTSQEGDEQPHRFLSDREFDVFKRLAEGESIPMIATTLGISPKTVSTHKFRLMQKLGIETDGELIRYALRNALVQ